MEIICDYCKNPFNYKGGNAHFNRSKKHYCGNECLGKSNVTHGLASRNRERSKRYRIWCSAKKRALKNNIYFNLLPEETPEIPEYCPVLGIKIISNTISSPLDSSPSLDRINPKIGYIKSNVRIISNRANRIKSDATWKELILIAEDLKKYENI